MSPPEVSVCLPTYEHHEFIDEALDSILAQDIDLEVCVVPVEGDKATLRRVQARAHEDARIRVQLSIHASITHQMNIAFYGCSGKWVIYFASDDVMLPGVLRSMVGFAESLDLVMCYPSFVYATADGVPTKVLHAPDYYSGIVHPKCRMGDVSLIRRDVLGAELPFRFADRRRRVWRVWRHVVAKYGAEGRIQRWPGIAFRYRQHGQLKGPRKPVGWLPGDEQEYERW